MPSAVTSPEEDVTLHCPSCGEEKFLFVPMSGKNGERFVRIHCHKCQEHLFFQNPELPNNIKSPEDIRICNLNGRNGFAGKKDTLTKAPQVKLHYPNMHNGF